MEYINEFETPEQYIKHQICKNNTNNTKVQKYELMKLCDRYGEKYSKTATSKEQLFDLVVPAHLSYYEVAKMYHIGIPSISIQKKFSISGDTIRLFAKNELIDIVGRQEYTDKDGNIKKANLYDTFAYYTLTPSKIRKWVKIITESK